LWYLSLAANLQNGAGTVVVVDEEEEEVRLQPVVFLLL
jgi:hypothetical protein